MDGPSIAGGDAGPHDPGMEARVSALEVGFQEMKGSLHRLELSVARIEVALSNVATKADFAALSEKVSAQGERLTKVEAAIEDTIKAALSKTLSPWQVPGILAVCVAPIGVLMAALNWAGHQPWFPH